MDKATIESVIDRALAKTITFPEILATLQNEGVESYQPPVMNDAQFDHAMKEMDIEMAKLKEIMES
jgi:homoaconitase/3-isopropylmalate dehydratase large subunit